jgi:hypothetical protein
MDVAPDREEAFRQFQAEELRRQTVAAEKTAVMSERTARDVGTLKTLAVVLACLLLLGIVVSAAVTAGGV